MKRVLAIASGGGHWVQLLRLQPALAGLEVAYCSVHKAYADQVSGNKYYVIKDVTRKNWFAVVVVFYQLFVIFVRERPDVLITTGAAPPLIAIVISKLFGTKSLWIDSIANCEQLSTSGNGAAQIADKCLSQWPDIARKKNVEYWGSVL